MFSHSATLKLPYHPHHETWWWEHYGRGACVKETFVSADLCRTAEERLTVKPPGYFLIRVSESRVGYTLSYR
uniref:Uncharacterized protein n=1 Tax=Poecilia latipinna TaxID=48699 RepID=A0A3B3V161_9TELE